MLITVISRLYNNHNCADNHYVYINSVKCFNVPNFNRIAHMLKYLDSYSSLNNSGLLVTTTNYKAETNTAKYQFLEESEKVEFINDLKELCLPYTLRTKYNFSPESLNDVGEILEFSDSQNIKSRIF